MAILFARLQADVPSKMRRGAWYRVIQLNGPSGNYRNHHRKVGVLRAWLEIAQRPPLRWSVVHGRPRIGKRHRIFGEPTACVRTVGRARPAEKNCARLECARCRQEFEINWEEGNGVQHAG